MFSGSEAGGGASACAVDCAPGCRSVGMGLEIGGHADDRVREVAGVEVFERSFSTPVEILVTRKCASPPKGRVSGSRRYSSRQGRAGRAACRGRGAQAGFPKAWRGGARAAVSHGWLLQPLRSPWPSG